MSTGKNETMKLLTRKSKLKFGIWKIGIFDGILNVHFTLLIKTKMFSAQIYKPN
jgi:hypothetical protein